jgi:catechol 2,3-dioxygenase-like lactoylglutathione lyase family enzyme
MRVSWTAFVLVAASCVGQSRPADRPAILGISHMAVYASDAAKTEHFYVHDIGLKKGEDPENGNGVRYYVNEEQFIEVLPLPGDAGANRLDHLAYLTANAEQMRAYLGAKGVTVPDAVKKGSDDSAWFDVQDPEGNKVEFVQPPAKLLGMKSTAALYTLTGGRSHRAADYSCGDVRAQSRERGFKFYREILGFKPYWYGGMHANHTDWISQQVPDGHDWVEYMVYNGTGIAGSHLAAAAGGAEPLLTGRGEHGDDGDDAVESEDRLGDAAPRPQIGRDGKWQFNALRSGPNAGGDDGVFGGGEALLLGVHGGESHTGGAAVRAGNRE